MPDSAVIFDAEGRVAMVVHPDRESELDDPAYNLRGHVQVRIARADYDRLPQAENFSALAHPHELMKALAPEVAKKSATVAAKIEARVAEAETARAIKAERDRLAAEAALTEPVRP